MIDQRPITVTMTVDDLGLERFKQDFQDLVDGRGAIITAIGNVAVHVMWNGTNVLGLQDIIQALGYSYCGSQCWLYNIACMGSVSWLTEPTPDFPNRQYRGKWPQSSSPMPIRFNSTGEEAMKFNPKLPHLLICPKGSPENP